MVSIQVFPLVCIDTVFRHRFSPCRESRMVRHFRYGLVIVGNALVALSGLASFGAYASSDSSGLQYILLYPAVWLAGLAVGAGGLLGVLTFRRPAAWLNFGLALLALGVAILPPLTEFGYA